MDKIFIIGDTLHQGAKYKALYQKLAVLESRLKTHGYEVVNPLKLYSEHTSLIEARKSIFAGMLECNAILLLDSWKEDTWAKYMFQIALMLEYRTYAERDLDHLTSIHETLRASVSDPT